MNKCIGYNVRGSKKTRFMIEDNIYISINLKQSIKGNEWVYQNKKM